MTFKLDDSLGFILNRSNTRLKNEFNQNLREYDVTPEQWAVLNRLWERDGISPKELAESIYKDLPNTARILDKLKNKSMVTLTRNPSDRRASLVYLTEKGRSLQAVLIPVAQRVLRKACRGLEAHQAEQLKIMLNKIFYNLE